MASHGAGHTYAFDQTTAHLATHTAKVAVVDLLRHEAAVVAPQKWLAWARRCRIRTVIDLAAKITRHRDSILAAIEHNPSNALIERTNTKMRLLTRMAFGYKHPDALIALAMLTLGGPKPALPGRA